MVADKEFGQKCVDFQQKIMMLCQTNQTDPNVVLSVFAAMTASLASQSNEPKEILEMFNRGMWNYYADLMKSKEEGEKKCETL